MGGRTDGHAKGARGCATTTALPPNPPFLRPPANSAAARRSARSTGSNATTAYNTSPSRSPAVYLAAATLLRSPFLAVASLSPSLSLSRLLIIARRRLSRIPPPLSFTCVHTRELPRVSPSSPPLSLFRSCSLSRSISPSVIAADCEARGNASAKRFAAAEATRAVTLPRCGLAATSRRPMSATPFRRRIFSGATARTLIISCFRQSDPPGPIERSLRDRKEERSTRAR